MHSYMRFWFLRSKMKQRWTLQNNKVKSLQLNTLLTPTSLLRYDCNRQSKSKLEDENKTHISYVSLASLSDEK